MVPYHLYYLYSIIYIIYYLYHLYSVTGKLPLFFFFVICFLVYIPLHLYYDNSTSLVIRLGGIAITSKTENLSTLEVILKR